MKLQTPVHLPSYSFQLDHTKKIISLGSCFADEIGKKLASHGYNVLNNPFGTIYNPRIFETIISGANGAKPELESSLIERDGRYHSLYFHSDFFAESATLLIQRSEELFERLKKTIKSNSVLILTLGTSKTYFHRTKDLEVGNCHKIPSGEFSSGLLGIEEIFESLSRSIKIISSLNDQAKIILTVSPIRHTADGMIQNQRSKARLVMAAERITEEFENVEYFPAYEILLDELRDYRFYSQDMVHPSQLAVDLIWEKFENSFIGESSRELGSSIQGIKKALNHKPFNPGSPEHQAFLNKTLEKAMQKDLQPFLEKEIKELRSRLI